MKRRTSRTLGVVAGAVLTAAPTAAPAWAQAPADPNPAIRTQATTADAQQKVLQYWTRERMQQATPMDHMLQPAKSAVPRQRRAFPTTGSPWAAGGVVARTTGRVFFTYQGRDASCTASAVAGANRSTVVTAGHCVKRGGTWHTNWVFVPGYNNGNRPYGTWTARQTLATGEWAATEDLNHDVGAAVVNQLNGRRLVDVVGGQGIAFNQPRRRNMYAFGYPAQDPYTGGRLIHCSGGTFDDFLRTRSIGMRCNMIGGASGGPWLTNFSESSGTGVINSVTSFRYESLSGYLFGTYFGGSERALYYRAQRA
ncbi:trypsin-like serine peptidase [Thermomonospora amylolytica]|uniref:trypsin-like serine peptidase n=1 Tax=Thermomonospora amylolytica TaxID=1411117 RepID=UPI000E6BEC05|nr:peptidase [Thermomonospora amylolytica]